MTRTVVSSNSPFETAIGYSRAVVSGDFVFVSGTTGFDYATMAIADEAPDQAHQALTNIAAVLATAGFAMADIVHIRYILPDRADFEPCWPVFKQWLGDSRPAATMIVAGLYDPRMKIEIEVTAHRPPAA